MSTIQPLLSFPAISAKANNIALCSQLEIIGLLITMPFNTCPFAYGSKSMPQAGEVPLIPSITTSFKIAYSQLQNEMPCRLQLFIITLSIIVFIGLSA